MKTIRQSAFETNSSSTHTLVICQGKHSDKLYVDENGVCKIYPGDYGWEEEEYNDAPTKASYCMALALNEPDGYLRTMLETVLLEVTGATSVVFVKDTGYYGGYGFVDHQSYDEALKAFESPNTLKDFIFNPASTLYTDNDNH